MSKLVVNLKLFVAIIFGTIWIFFGLFLNLLQFICYILLYAHNPGLFRKINYYLTYASWSQIVALSEWWSGSRVRITFADEETEKHFGTEHALVLMNHKYEVDWLFAWMVCDKFKMLGTAKAFAKSSLKWVPVIGWGWFFCEMIFLERNWDKDSIILGQSLDKLVEYTDYFLLLVSPLLFHFHDNCHRVILNSCLPKGRVSPKKNIKQVSSLPKKRVYLYLNIICYHVLEASFSAFSTLKKDVNQVHCWFDI